MFARRWAQKFAHDDTATLAASIAFYFALSFAPMVIVFLTVSAELVPTFQQTLIADADRYLGAELGAAFGVVLQNVAHPNDTRILIRTVGFSTALLSAGLIFGQLRVILNRIFEVGPRSTSSGIIKTALRFVLTRFVDMTWAMGFIAALTTGLVVSQILQSSAFLLGLFFPFFCLMFRYLPNARIEWPQAVVGGALASALFFTGKALISFYLDHSNLATPYGAAGSVVALLVWVYYSSLMTFVSAQIGYLLNPKFRIGHEPGHHHDHEIRFFNQGAKYVEIPIAIGGLDSTPTSG